MLKVTKTDIPDLLILEPEVFRDERGFFMESYNEKGFREATGLDVTFVQDNHSRSKKNVLRGLHYQIKHSQGKLVRVTRGKIFDVAVDIRRTSPTFKKWVGVELSEDNNRQLWIPPGFAHGFYVLSEEADVYYKTTDYYSPEDEKTIIWNDSDLNICWPKHINPILSENDKRCRPFVKIELFSFN